MTLQPVSTPWQLPWPEGCIARYWTVAGATVDITYDSHTGLLNATCTGCGNVDQTDTCGLCADTPETERERAEEWLPDSRKQAQAHASVCRALPPPAVTQ